MQDRPPQPVSGIHIEIVGVRFRLDRTGFRPGSSSALTTAGVEGAGGDVSSPLELALKRLLITLGKESMERVHARLSESTDTALTVDLGFPRTTPQMKLCLIDGWMHSR